MTFLELENRIFEIAREDLGKGIGQEPTVLDRLKNELLGENERRILDVWHGLFRKGKLVWGFDLNNPGAPYFHLPVDG